MKTQVEGKVVNAYTVEKRRWKYVARGHSTELATGEVECMMQGTALALARQELVQRGLTWWVSIEVTPAN